MMTLPVTDYAQALHEEIEQGLKEALAGETYDVSTLWDGVDVD